MLKQREQESFKGWYEIETGLSHFQLLFDPGKWSCGSMPDGIALKLLGLEGTFSISFEDLEQMYELAKAEREVE